MGQLEEEIKKTIEEIKKSFDENQEIGPEEMELLFLASLIEERSRHE